MFFNVVFKSHALIGFVNLIIFFGFRGFVFVVLILFFFSYSFGISILWMHIFIQLSLFFLLKFTWVYM